MVGKTRCRTAIGMIRPEKVPRLSDFGNGFNRQRIGRGLCQNRFKIALNHMEQFAVHHEFFRAGNQPALKPTGRVIDHIGPRLHRCPEGIGGLPHRLPVGDICGTTPG